MIQVGGFLFFFFNHWASKIFLSSDSCFVCIYSAVSVCIHRSVLFLLTCFLLVFVQLITAYIPSDDDLSCALKPVNSEKNRSTDFLPVNLKRVILPARPGIEGSEYINATYLQVGTYYSGRGVSGMRNETRWREPCEKSFSSRGLLSFDQSATLILLHFSNLFLKPTFSKIVSNLSVFFTATFVSFVCGWNVCVCAWVGVQVLLALL